MDIAAEANRIRSVDLDAPYSAVTVSLDAGSTTFETYADLHEGLDLAKDDEAAFFGAGGAGRWVMLTARRLVQRFSCRGSWRF